MFDGRIITSGELFVKAQYMNFMLDNTKWYWGENHNRTISFLPHEKFYVIEVKNTNKNQGRKAIQKIPICLRNSDHDLYLMESKVETQLNIISKPVLMIGVNK